MTVHRPLCPEGRLAHADVAAAPCNERARPFVLAATILASAMAFIDGTVVTIALPAIQRDLAADFQVLQWVVNAYTLMLGALILVGGGLGDRIGRRRVFVIGIIVFAGASVLCALAFNGALLIIARGLQGVGAALLVPQSLAIISASFPKEIRGAAIGTWAAASAITTALGPSLGGLLIDSFGWRWAFWINLPLSAAAVWLAVRFVPESRDEAARGPIDWIGSVLAVLAIGAVAYGLTSIGEGRDATALSFVTLAAGLAGLAVFVLAERRATNPLMPPSLFTSWTFSGANLLTVFLYGALSGVLFLLPFELIERRGLTATEVGLSLLPIGIIIGALSRSFGALADRRGPRPLLIGGAVLTTVACAGLAVGHETYWLGVMLPVVVLSFGMAAVVSPLTTAVMNAVPDEQSGAASGVNNAASRLAGLLAVALLGAAASFLFSGRATAFDAARFGSLPSVADPARPVLESAFQAAYAGAMWLAAVWAALAVATAVTLIRGDPASGDSPSPRA